MALQQLKQFLEDTSVAPPLMIALGGVTALLCLVGINPIMKCIKFNKLTNRTRASL